MSRLRHAAKRWNAYERVHLRRVLKLDAQGISTPLEYLAVHLRTTVDELLEWAATQDDAELAELLAARRDTDGRH